MRKWRNRGQAGSAIDRARLRSLRNGMLTAFPAPNGRNDRNRKT